MLNLRMSENQPEQTEANSSQSLQPSQNESSLKAGSIEQADHFDDLIATSEAANITVSGENNGQMIGKDDFRRLFVGGFDVASEFSGLQSLKVSDADARTIAASDSLYDTINDIPALRGLLNPSNKWYGRAFNIGFFFWCMSRAVAEEIAEKQAQADQRQPQTAAQSGGVDIPQYNMGGTA